MENDNHQALFDYLTALKTGTDDWYKDYQSITSPYFEPRFFIGKSLIEGVDTDKILASDPFEILPHPDNIEREYNANNFAITVLKAKKLQKILALENALVTGHSGKDLVEVEYGRTMTYHAITKFFHHAASLREDPFNRLDAQETFDPERSMADYARVKRDMPIMDDPWKFGGGNKDTKKEILQKLYELRIEFAERCMEQVAMNMAFARDMLVHAISARVLVDRKVIPEFHPALEHAPLYPEIGADFIRNAKDNIRLAGYYLANVDEMKPDTDRNNSRPIERYVPIDPDFGLR